MATAASSTYSCTVTPLRHLYVFHYHLLPGGVTTVIRDGLRALLAHAALVPDLRRITVVTAGHADGALPVTNGSDAAPQVTRERLDLVGYDAAPATAAEQRQLADLLLRRYGDGVWWVHNHHLAKNTRFTGAVLAAAAAGQPMLLQIHDFPECARPANLRRLLREVPASPYPARANVRYAVLNRRDHAALGAAGLPAGRIALLANPVRPVPPLPAPDAPPAQAARAALARAAAAQPPIGSGCYSAGRPLWLYPVRVRRRKNVLEAGLLARLADANLVVTLRASSPAETPYSRQVEELFAEGTVPGLFGVGERLDACGVSFDALLAAAHRIVSPSVEEGFGFQFVNALQWRRPLLARRLPVLDDLGALLDGYPGTIYDAVQCPLPRAARTALLDAYGPGIDRAARRLPAGWRDRLRAEMEKVLGGDCVDFSFLGVAWQIDLLRRTADRGLIRELEQANAPLLAALREVPAARPPSRERRIDDLLGEAAFAGRAAAVLRPLMAPEPETAAAGAAVRPEAVRRFFAGPATLRLLMES